MKIISILSVLVGITGLLLLGVPTGEVLADGTETLGPPSISISQGTNVVAAGVGLAELQPGDIDITVPVGAAVTQVLLYWEGFMATNVPGDDTITVNGNSVTGTLIGGQAFFFGGAWSSAFRADITSLGLVGPGTSTLTVGDLVFSDVSNGAGVVVIYDDGSDITDIDIRDGLDLAFINFPEPRKSTIAQTFTFSPSPVDRVGTLAMFFSSVSGTASSGGPLRPSSIDITVDGTTTTFSNQLDSNDGDEWDTVNASVTIPAGASSLTVQAFSRDDFGDGQDPLAASFTWTAAAFSIQGCSIGDYVWEDANRDGCQDGEERGINGVTVELYENCEFEGDPITFETIAKDGQDGFYEFKNLVCGQQYGIRFVNPDDIYAQTEPNSCPNPIDNDDTKDSDCGDDGKVCATAGDENAAPGSDNPTIDCGYVCEGKIGDYVWLDENEDGCQDEVNTGIAGVDVTLSEDCDVQANPQTVQTNADGFYEFAGLCPGQYFVEFGNGRPNTDPGQVCDGDPDVSDEKDSNCGDEALQCVELTRDNPEDPTIDCGKVGPCLELEKRVSGDGGLNFFDADNCSDADVPFTVDDAVYKLIVTNCGKEAVTLDKIVDLDLGINLILNPTVTIQPNGSVEFNNDAGQTQGLLQKVGACPDPDGAFDNTATVFGMGAGSNLPVEATDPACVKCGPCVDLLKEVSVDGGQTWEDANDPDCSDGPGTSDPAEYRLTIENCGGETLVNVFIDDDVLGIDNVPVDDIPVGDSIILTQADIPALAKQDLCPLTPGDPGVIDNFLRNIAKVDAQGQTSGIPVSDEDPACVKCVCIDLVKEVSVDDGVTWFDANDEECNDGPTTQDQAEYRLIIENCGSVLLTDVVVSDFVLGIPATDVPDLDVGESIILTEGDIPGLAKEDLCPLTPGDPGVEDSFLRNVARVDAVGDGVAVSDADPACVKCCPLEVEKEVFPETIECVDSGTDGGTDGDDPDECICPCEDSGTNGDPECIVEKVTYTYTVRNTGDVALLDVTVFDDQLGVIAEFPVLEPGATEIIPIEDVCLCEETTNKVIVTATLADGTLCTAMDEATVTTDLDCGDTGTDGP